MAIPASPFDGMSACLVGQAPTRAVQVNKLNITCFEQAKQHSNRIDYRIVGHVNTVKAANDFILGKQVKFNFIVLPGGIPDAKAGTQTRKDTGTSGASDEGRHPDPGAGKYKGESPT